jgi:hypothetical protein
MPLLDLDEFAVVGRMHPLASANRPAPLWIRRADFMGDSRVALRDEVSRVVSARFGRVPEGPIAVLANVRTWGWLFNPISFYLCFDRSGEVIETLVAEVENTPWHERVSYVVGAPGTYRFPKALHVSPFLPMELDYVLTYGELGEEFSCSFDVMSGDKVVLAARLNLHRTEMSRRNLTRLVRHAPPMAHRVTAGIYVEAARLLVKGVRFIPHPARAGVASSRSGRGKR